MDKFIVSAYVLDELAAPTKTKELAGGVGLDGVDGVVGVVVEDEVEPLFNLIYAADAYPLTVLPLLTVVRAYQPPVKPVAVT